MEGQNRNGELDRLGFDGNGSEPGWSGKVDAFGYPRAFTEHHFVYTVISPRAGGLSVGVNVNPDRTCNFDCAYCEVDRRAPLNAQVFDIELMATELRHTLELIKQGRLREWSRYRNVPEDLLRLRHVALSGDGEPTLASNFAEVVQAVVHLRAISLFPFFKLVLVTNGTGLDKPAVEKGLKFFTSVDEVWVKLDGGTQEYLEKVDRLTVPIETILRNIVSLGRRRSLVIQSLFPAIEGEPPPAAEIEKYADRLRELTKAGAQISLVQIYSATRPIASSSCGHLPLKTLSEIARHVRRATGLRAEVF